MSDGAGQWRRLIASLEASGLSRAEFCRRRDISYHAMVYWQRRLQPAGRQSASFVEVSVPQVTAPGGSIPAVSTSNSSMPDGSAPESQAVASPSTSTRKASSAAASTRTASPATSTRTASSAAAAPAARYEIVLGNGRSIRCGAAFEDQAVARLVRTLEALPSPADAGRTAPAPSAVSDTPC